MINPSDIKPNDYFRFSDELTDRNISNFGLPIYPGIRTTVWKVNHIGEFGLTDCDIHAVSVTPKVPFLTFYMPCRPNYFHILSQEEVEKINRQANWFKMYKKLDITTHPRTKIFH